MNATTESRRVAVERLCVRLGRKDVLREASAVFPPSQLSVIVGPNGAGKSTLVRALLGIVPRTKGDVEVGGRDVATYNSKELARTVAFIPQDTHVDFSFRVREVVFMGRYPHLEALERERPIDHQVVTRTLQELELQDFAERTITSLSVGERQRVLLARALATEARILVGDEPISALDIGHRLETLDLLKRHARAGLTVIVVLHDLDLALRFADRVVLLDRGRVVSSGEPLATLTSPELENAFAVRVEKLAQGKSLYFRRKL